MADITNQSQHSASGLPRAAPESFSPVFQPVLFINWGWHVKTDRFASAFWPKLFIIQMEMDRETLSLRQTWVQFFIFLPLSECAFMRTVFIGNDKTTNSNRFKQTKKTLQCIRHIQMKYSSEWALGIAGSRAPYGVFRTWSVSLGPNFPLCWLHS